MASIIAYQKITTAGPNGTTLQPTLPDGATELCTLDSTTYASLPDGATLAAEQPVSVETISLTDTLRDAIKAASPHVRLINQRMIDKIRDSYTVEDEMYFARIGVGAANGLYAPTENEMQEMTVFGEFVESVREWGRSQRAALGL